MAVTPPGDAELHLLTDWTEPGRNARIGRSAVLSLLTHIAAIVFLLSPAAAYITGRVGDIVSE